MIIDVSHHNGTIKWLSASKVVDSVFIKATQGTTYRDPMFIKNATAANLSGIKVGYYHFATLNSHDVITDATDEANWFISNIKKAPSPSLPLVLDLEDEKNTLNRDDTLRYVKTFFRQLVLNGYHDYILYSGTHYLNDHLPVNHGLEYVKLWIADYNEPHFIPNGWEEITLLQYTDKGTIEGIKGNVDLNRYL